MGKVVLQEDMAIIILFLMNGVVPRVHPADIQQQLVNQVVKSVHLVNIQHTKQLHV